MMILLSKGSLLALLLPSIVASSSSLSSSSQSSKNDLQTYTFESYVSDYNKPYKRNTDEWKKRQDIFESNKQIILDHNAKEKEDEDVTHTLGVNEFMDKDSADMFWGYDKSSHPAWLSSSSEESKTSRRLSSHRMELPFDVEPIDKLPKSIDWREKNVVNAVKDQGSCGSCWAFASIAALEAHIAIQTGTLYSLSEQQLVSCVQNSNNCGGSGGCAGATAEVAYDYVATDGVGIATEESMPYTASDGVCPAQQEAEEDVMLRGVVAREAFDLNFEGAVATIEGYADTSTNSYLELMNAVAKWGPAVIAVAASPWMFYSGGVFSSPKSTNTRSAYDIDHGVVVVGYGTDEESGKDYWIVRNSWGASWGENGYIRLERNDPSTLENEDDDCGMDVSPKDGVQCDVDENGNKPPSKVEVCGTSGILFDVTLPVGGKLLN